MEFDEIPVSEYSKVSGAETKTVPLNTNGHLLTREPQTETSVMVLQLGDEKVFHWDRLHVSYSCGLCGQIPKVHVSKDGVVVEGPCPDRAGITTTITLKVPSGKIVVDDSLSGYNGFDDENQVDYNSARGQAQVIEAFAKQGCAFGPVGNSCPGLWKTSDGTYVIARMPYDEETDEQVPRPPEAVKVASIITDLWAYSIADFEDWKSKGHGDADSLGWTPTVVDVEPGTYAFSHHTNELGFDGDADYVVFAHIKKIA